MKVHLECVRLLARASSFTLRITAVGGGADCELVLVAGANTDPTGAVILRKDS